MGETLQPVMPRFNRSLRIESRAEWFTGDPGAIVLSETLENSGIVTWMTERLSDPRRQEDVVHDLASLIRTSVLLAARGRRDHDDADGCHRSAIGASDDGDAPRSRLPAGGEFVGRADAVRKPGAGLAADAVSLQRDDRSPRQSEGPP